MKPTIEINLILPSGHKETMTREQARELRDLLDDIVGERDRIVINPPQIVPLPYYRPWTPYQFWCVGNTSNTFTISASDSSAYSIANSAE